MNELKNAASPYLQQHADNPVDWRQWTPATLAAAKALGKPILLSVGYAACHWCHVMAHESFEDPATAAVMNELFVNIKVDREERPDVDHIYMSALHAFGQRGGWPLTMFLTPEAEPFWGGTYFPNKPRYGQPAFVSVLTSVERAFRADPDRIASNTKAILEHLGREQQGAAKLVSLDEMNALAARLADHMDPVHGGMQGAPKFPNPQILEFLWRAAGRGIPRCADLVLLSLERMSQGGIYDHLGGGFARYSVDDRWLVPHFEKMLYDNAQLIELLTLAATATRTPAPLRALFAARVEETIGWLLREMTDESGAFYASLDADSEGVEGKFYVWTLDEITAALGPDDAAFFAEAYDVTPTGNWEEPDGPTVTILNRLEAAALAPGDEARLAGLRAKLLAGRAARIRPGCDDKIMADWNGLMIAAVARAGVAFDRADWLERAAAAFGGIMDRMARRGGDGLDLAHSHRGAVDVRPAFALDHAAMARAALVLAEARGDAAASGYRDDAAALLEVLLARYRDRGLLAMASADASDVILRLRPTQDDAIPNAHSVALDALIRLAALDGSALWLDAADEMFEALSGAMQANFVGHAGVMNALDLRLRGASVVVAGPSRAPLRSAALHASWLTRSVIDVADAAGLPRDHPAHAQVAGAGRGAAFVCRGATCSLPVHDVAALEAQLAEA